MKFSSNFPVAQIFSFSYIGAAHETNPRKNFFVILSNMQIKDILTEKRLCHLEPMVAEINVQELKTKIDAGEIFKLIEVSNPEHFQTGHIKGAMNIPLNSLEQTAPQQFRKFQQIVIYSQDANSSVSAVAARTLQKLGFTNVLALKGGKEAWKNAGFPLEGQGNDKS